MTQRWTLDEDDPRAPTTDTWRAMTEAQRAHVLATLPSEWEDAEPPEGDPHWVPKVAARKTLERYFSRIGRRAYVGSELPIYYPGERVFAPDVFAVLDVEPGARDHWVVDKEGKGLDWVLEIFVHGSRKKDHVKNVERNARLGITDYFIFDRGKLRLHGWTLPTPTARTYEPILPQRGRWAARSLGLELAIVDDRPRFFHADAELPEVEELIDRLERAVAAVSTRVEEESRRAEAESQRAEEESRRAEEESRRRLEAEQRLTEALAEIERLKGVR